MIAARIQREPSSEHGTFGRIVAKNIDAIFECDTLELPWKTNRRNVSCIPSGSYQCDWSHSGKFGNCYRLREVPGRSGILIHAGNYAGDRSQKMRSDVEGCILLGLSRSEMAGQRCVTQSRHALAAFIEFMGEKGFRLAIEDAAPITPKPY